MREFNDIKKRRLLIMWLVLTVILTAGNYLLGDLYGEKSVNLAGMEVHISTINGCIQILIYMVGIAMIFASPKLGLWLDIAVIVTSLPGAIMVMVRTGSLVNLTAPVNGVFFLIASIAISRQCRASARRAVTDDITGLCNSYEFEHSLYKKILFNENGYLFIIHIDGFSQENANLGRESGDEILRTISTRINDILDNNAQAFKLEGPEFSVILSEYVDYEYLADKIIQTIEQPISIRKGDLVTNCYVTPYIGIVLFLDGNVSARNLIKRGDIAKNYALKSAQGKICVFTDEMNEKLDRELQIERKIKESLTNGYFNLVYQPQYTAPDKKLRGYEALIRMTHPSGEQVSAGELISVAEKSELIFDIDRYVLRRAMKEFSNICRDSGYKTVIAVNISAKEIARVGFADKLLKMVDELNFPAACLEIEITEYSFSEAKNHTIDNIKKLRAKGVMIALDDFGTGYTSLGQLMTLPINLLKVDKSLIDNVLTTKANTDFIKSIIYMGHLMNAEVIAEGVETEEQLNMLRELNCDYIQGYLWGKPTEYHHLL